MERRGLRADVRGGRREESKDNELSIDTKAELYNFVMSLILRKDKCNNDNEAPLMRPRHQFTLCNNLFLG